MKRKLLVLLAVVLVSVSGLAQSDRRIKEVEDNLALYQSSAPRKYEYKVVPKDFSDATEQGINTLSGQGWELVAVDDKLLYLKRVKQ